MRTVYNPPLMRREITGDHAAEGLRIAIVASRFNEEIVEGLVGGALDCLDRHGMTEDVPVYRVPGAFEIPVAARKLADSGRYDVLIALGALIRGDTPHFEYISSQATNELSRVAVDSGVPVAYGVITCNTVEQARARSAAGGGNKGWEAALAAVEMANLFRTISRDTTGVEFLPSGKEPTDH
jgi:6,7-dimethyl-8-ribityllumazine synthase